MELSLEVALRGRGRFNAQCLVEEVDPEVAHRGKHLGIPAKEIETLKVDRERC